MITYFVLYDRYTEANVSANVHLTRKLPISYCSRVNLNWIGEWGCHASQDIFQVNIWVKISADVGGYVDCSLFQLVMSQYHEHRRHPCSATTASVPLPSLHFTADSISDCSLYTHHFPTPKISQCISSVQVLLPQLLVPISRIHQAHMHTWDNEAIAGKTCSTPCPGSSIPFHALCTNGG